MDCSEFIERHSEYVDGEMPMADFGRWRDHVASCGKCARYDRTVRRGGQLVRDLLPRVEAAPDFRPRLRHRLYHERDGISTRPAPTWLYAAVAIIATASAGVVLAALAPSDPVVEARTVVAAPPLLVGPASRVRLPGAAAVSGDVAEAEAAPAAEVAAWPVYSRGDVASEFVAPAVYERALRPARAVLVSE